jgi:hypothetical protein
MYIIPFQTLFVIFCLYMWPCRYESLGRKCRHGEKCAFKHNNEVANVAFDVRKKMEDLLKIKKKKDTEIKDLKNKNKDKGQG